MPLLGLLRSHDRRQNGVTGLGLLCDAALHAPIINGATDGNAYWFLCRAEAIVREATQGRDLSSYEQAFGADGDPHSTVKSWSSEHEIARYLEEPNDRH